MHFKMNTLLPLAIQNIILDHNNYQKKIEFKKRWVIWKMAYAKQQECGGCTSEIFITNN